MDRYRRQKALPEIGDEGQRRIAAGRVVVMGCGALGAMNAALLARAGVGRLTVVDRDVVQVDNLHRQVLYDEADAEAGLPKAEAAAAALRRANSGIAVRAVVADVDRHNVLDLVRGADAVVDGADNFEMRALVNEACVREGVAFVHGAVLGTYGVQATVLPGRTPCLACWMPDLPEPGTLPTCETAGVLGPVVAMVAAIQATETLKVLVGRPERLRPTLLSVDPWTGERAEVHASRSPDCRVCGLGRFDFLEGRVGARSEVLCGREAVQVRLEGPVPRLASVAARLDPEARPRLNPYMLRFEAEGLEVTLFSDGRAIVRGTPDPSVARAVLSRWVGM